jgi:hypothetical protein
LRFHRPTRHHPSSGKETCGSERIEVCEKGAETYRETYLGGIDACKFL